MNFEQGLEVVDEIVLLKIGRRLNHAEIAVFKGSWYLQTYEEIAKETNFSASYLKRRVGPNLWKILSKALNENVSKTNFKSAVEHQVLIKYKQHRDHENLYYSATEHSPLKTDLGEAVDVSDFCGRIEELSTLQKWIINDRCRLVTILGMGGIGKTAIAAKLITQIQNEFDYIIWRSLRNAPSVEKILGELIHFFSQEELNNLPKTIEDRILVLMEYLRSNRCLLILDNVESVLQSCDTTGSYRKEYESYGHLLRCIGETVHQSSLILTSREKPKGLATKEGENFPIRSLQITGLNLVEAQKIFDLKGTFKGSETGWQSIITYYAGNPLILKMVATKIVELFQGELNTFVQLHEKKLIFDNIHELFTKQFNRLTTLEECIMYWLAINQEPISYDKLHQDFVSQKKEDIFVQKLSRELLECLSSLQRRSLIKKIENYFTQEPIIMDYVIEKFINFYCDKIANSWEINTLLAINSQEKYTHLIERKKYKRFIIQYMIEKFNHNFTINTEYDVMACVYSDIASENLNANSLTRC